MSTPQYPPPPFLLLPLVSKHFIAMYLSEKKKIYTTTPPPTAKWSFRYTETISSRSTTTTMSENQDTNSKTLNDLKIQIYKEIPMSLGNLAPIIIGATSFSSCGASQQRHLLAFILTFGSVQLVTGVWRFVFQIPMDPSSYQHLIQPGIGTNGNALLGILTLCLAVWGLCVSASFLSGNDGVGDQGDEDKSCNTMMIGLTGLACSSIPLAIVFGLLVYFIYNRIFRKEIGTD